MPGHEDGVQGDVAPPETATSDKKGGPSGILDQRDQDENRQLGLGQALAPPD